MKSIYQAIAVSGANLLALTLNIGDTTVLKPHFSNSPESSRIQNMTDSQMRSIEASHLEVYAGCKWGHAAFDPIKVESEEISPEIKALHNQVALT